MGLFSLDDQLTAYGQYHYNQWNRAVHMLCVPLLFWSAMALVAHAPVVFVLDTWPLNASFCITFGFLFYYALLEPWAAALMAPIMVTMTYSANVFAIKSNYDVRVPLFIQLFSWAAQVLSHAFVEKRSPALLDSFLQLIVVAPFFVFLEMLFVLGYRPGLQKRINDKTRAAINTWRLRVGRQG